jgi:hypothetical protein
MIRVDMLERPIKVDIRSSIPITIGTYFGTPGPRGLPGNDGVDGTDAPQQVFYQATQPPYNGVPFIWFETNGVDEVLNLWVNDGTA